MKFESASMGTSRPQFCVDFGAWWTAPSFAARAENDEHILLFVVGFEKRSTAFFTRFLHSIFIQSCGITLKRDKPPAKSSGWTKTKLCKLLCTHPPPICFLATSTTTKTRVRARRMERDIAPHAHDEIRRVACTPVVVQLPHFRNVTIVQFGHGKLPIFVRCHVTLCLSLMLRFVLSCYVSRSR